MIFDFECLTEDERYKLMLATVLPRPIAWVTSMDRSGIVNAAPFSFFNAFGTEPPTVGIGIGRQSATRPKDTAVNIRATEEFVVNLVPFSAAEKMRATSMPFPSDVSEISAVGLATVPSSKVRPPKIADSPVSFECTFMQEIRLGNFSLFLGRIAMLHIRDDAMPDPATFRVDAEKLDLIGRMEGSQYTRTRDKFEPSADLGLRLMAQVKY